MARLLRIQSQKLHECPIYEEDDMPSAVQVRLIPYKLGPVHSVLRRLAGTSDMPDHVDFAPRDQSLWLVGLVCWLQHHHASWQCAIWHLSDGALPSHACQL